MVTSGICHTIRFFHLRDRLSIPREALPTSWVNVRPFQRRVEMCFLESMQMLQLNQTPLTFNNVQF